MDAPSGGRECPYQAYHLEYAYDWKSDDTPLHTNSKKSDESVPIALTEHFYQLKLHERVWGNALMI